MLLIQWHKGLGKHLMTFNRSYADEPFTVSCWVRCFMHGAYVQTSTIYYNVSACPHLSLRINISWPDEVSNHGQKETKNSENCLQCFWMLLSHSSCVHLVMFILLWPRSRGDQAYLKWCAGRTESAESQQNRRRCVGINVKLLSSFHRLQCFMRTPGMRGHSPTSQLLEVNKTWQNHTVWYCARSIQVSCDDLEDSSLIFY